MSQDIGVYYFGGNTDCPIPKATESELGNLDVGGDISGTVESATVAKINGVALGTTTATSGNVLTANGTNWATSTKDNAGIVDKTSAQNIAGAKNLIDPLNYSLLATADNIAYTSTFPAVSLQNGQLIAFKMPNHASGASCTLNANSLGAKKLLRASDQATQITTSDLVANGIYLAQYNTSLDTGSGAWVVIDTPVTSNFAVTNSSNSFAGAQVFAGTANFGETAGTAPTYTATLAITALVDGAWARLKIHSASTADDATLNVNSLGAKPIAKQSTGAQVTDINDLREKVIYDFVYSDDAISGGAWIALGI